MPFGQKSVDEESIDFDATWQELLRPGVPEGWESVRIDEVDAPGSIPDQYKHYLRIANTVVFDLTSANPNVLYELGIRDVFAPGRRVLVAREGTTLPFNIAGERVLFYPRDLQVARTSDFGERLRAQILAAGVGSSKTSEEPPPESRLKAQFERATTLPALIAVWESWKGYTRLPAHTLMLLAKAFGEQSRLDLAVEVARRAYAEEPQEWDIARTLGWYLRRQGCFDDAAHFFEQALAINPRDVESMGMLGGMYKRRALILDAAGKAGEAKEWFTHAKETYARAVEVDALSIYNLVNMGALTFIAEGNGPNAAYQRLVEIVEGQDLQRASTWDLIALAEAYVVLNRVDDAGRAYALATARKDFTLEIRDSAAEQLKLLERFGLLPAVVRQAHALLSGEHVRPGKDLILVHLSDVHFGKKPGAEAAAVEMHRFRAKGPLHSNRTLAEHITTECKDFISSECSGEQGRLVVVISGDIAYQATQEEYEQANVFVSSLLKTLDIPRHQFVVVPGNHDVNWKLSGHQASHRFDEFLKFIRKVFGKEKLNEFYPHLNWDYAFDSDRPGAEQIVSVHKLEEDGVVIIGFNSCVMEDHNLHFGAIGASQMALAAKSLAGVDPSWLRIAVMHHHVLPLESQLSTGENGAAMDGTIVRDYALVERRLHELGFDMVLHGHKHEPGIRVSELVSTRSQSDRGKSIVVCGAGSAGVESNELPHGWGNHFAIYRISEGRRRPGSPFMSAVWKELPYDDISSQWTTRGRWTING